MKAWIGQRQGSLPVYTLQNVEKPQPAPNEVLVRVRAVGLNLVDRFPKKQHFTHTPPLAYPIPGMEVAGEVSQVGSGVSSYHEGERVMAMVHGGCAEYCCAAEQLLMPVPDHISWAEAAAIPLSFLTAHDALITHAGLKTGGTVLIQGVTTGVGLAAVQLARVHGAALIAGTSRSQEKLERLKPLGLQLGVLSGSGVAEALLKATAGRGVDIVLDHLGGRVLDETLKASAIGGRIINIGRYSGTRGEIDLELLSLRRLTLVGVSFRTRSLAEHAAIVSAFMLQHANDLANRALHAVIDKVFDFDQLPAAITRATAGSQFGKLVLAWESS